MQNADIVKSLLAIVPIVMIFVLMLIFKLPSYKAGFAALLAACVLAFFIWKMDFAHMGQAAAEGVLSALMPIAWVIFTAMLLYKLSVISGAMETIRKTLVRYAPDEASQVLLIAFGFGSFLESVSGFGTPVVVVASMLILFGFEPLRAAVLCLVANTVSVAFGVVGIPVITLSSVTALPVKELSLYVSLQLFLFSVLLPFLLVWITVKSFQGLKKYAFLCLASGITYAAVQTLAAWVLGPELAAVIGSLCAMSVIILWQRKRQMIKTKDKIPAGKIMKAWSAYIIVFILVIGTRLMPFLSFLDKPPFRILLAIYQGGDSPFTASLLTNPGTLLLISAILFSFIYKIPWRAFFVSAWETLKQAKNAIFTVVLIVALAKILSHSGMTGDLALGFAQLSGSLYPFISPVIGCLGTFVTGSDTSSNILFGMLQKETALYIGVNPLWLAAANTSGAVIGKLVSPLSIALASSSAGKKGQESVILKSTIGYAAGMIAAMAVLIYATSFLFQTPVK